MPPVPVSGCHLMHDEIAFAPGVIHAHAVIPVLLVVAVLIVLVVVVNNTVATSFPASRSALRTLHAGAREFRQGLLRRSVVVVALRCVSLRMIAAHLGGLIVWLSAAVAGEGLGTVFLHDLLELPQQLLDLDSVLLR